MLAATQATESPGLLSTLIIYLADSTSAYLVGCRYGVYVRMSCLIKPPLYARLSHLLLTGHRFVAFSTAPSVWQRLGTYAEMPLVLTWTLRYDDTDTLTVGTVGRSTFGIAQVSTILSELRGNACPRQVALPVASQRQLTWPTVLAPASPTGSPSAPAEGSGSSTSNTVVLAILGIVGGMIGLFAMSRLWLCLTGSGASTGGHDDRSEQYASLEAQSMSSANA
jgi:hypothetical protein